MNTMIERYINVAVSSVPEGQRAEVGREIQTAIDEMMEQRLENGEPERMAATAALEELGDPRMIAREYRDSPQYLIGPGWFPLYIEVLKRILPIALVAVGVIAMVAKIATTDADLFEGIVSGIGSAFEIGLQVLLWVTIGFFIAERTVVPHPGADKEGKWTIDDLPDAPAERGIGLGETVGTVLTLVVLGALVVSQQTRGVGFFIFGGESGDWESMPLINPDLGSGWVIGFIAIMAVSAIVAVASYLGRVWTFRLVVLTAIEAAAWIGYFLALAASEPIVNPEFARRVSDGEGNWWATGNQANQVVSIVIIAYSLWDVWDAWNRYRGNRNISEMSALAA